MNLKLSQSSQGYQFRENNEVSAWVLFAMLFLIFYFFPLFPSVAGFASKLGYLPLLCLFFPLIVKKIPRRSYGAGVLLYASAKFLLHFWAELVDSANGGVLNPTSLLVGEYFVVLVYFSYFMFFHRYNSAWSFLRGSLVLLIIATFLYVIIEIFFLEHFSFFIHFFYKREWREVLEAAGISFFFTTYFAAHMYLLLFSLSLSIAVCEKRVEWLIFAFLSFLLVFFAQSKTGILSAFVITTFVFYARLKFRYFLIYSLLFLIAIIGVFLFFDVESYYLVKSGISIIEGKSNSLYLRLDQIKFSFSEIEKYFYLFGAGVGRDILLESWVSLYLYRYGFIGIVVYLLFWTYLLWSAWSAYNLISESKIYYKPIALGVFSWFLIIPIISLSSSVWDVPKNGFFVFVMLAAVNSLKLKFFSEVSMRNELSSSLVYGRR